MTEDVSDYDEDPITNEARRRFLVTATSVIGAIGVVGAAVPFIASWEPSARATAAGSPVDISIKKLEPGQMVTVSWRSRPVWVLHRTPEQLATLSKLNDDCKDPDSRADQQFSPKVQNIYRSLEPAYFVCVGICTHLGCIPDYKPTPHSPEMGPQWLGGFFCPCHGSHYDLAGRVLKGSPAPLNLPVLPYYFLNDREIRVGTLADGSMKDWKPNTW